MKLVLEDGNTFLGRSFGYSRNIAGEVVFNTGMVGYSQALTDPSYRGQILILSYPLQGNYGVSLSAFESGKIQVQGLIISNYTENASHFSSELSLKDWLIEEKIPALCELDTRSLICYIRDRGTLKGKLFTNSDDNVIDDFLSSQLLSNIVKQQAVLYGFSDTTILLIDTGCKLSIIQTLLSLGVRVLCVPWYMDWERYLSEVDGVLLPNGPGDPANAMELVDRIRTILKLDIPIFGICLGHQLLGLAAGFTSEKMKYGHRSLNQPVRNLLTGNCYITSQNHGYVLNQNNTVEDWKPWFVNLNDSSNEGILHKHKFIRSVQFHPEANPGPHDTIFLFKEFVEAVNVCKKNKVVTSFEFLNPIEFNLKNIRL